MRDARAKAWSGGIPAELTSFVGRRHELAEVKRLLSVARLVTLTGVGGAGKTRLALRVAAESCRAFPDGAWFVDLAALQNGSPMEYTVAAAVGIRDQTDRPVAEVIGDYLRDRQLLLVLDNCEHLLDTCAEFTATALRTAPGLRILCTSRQPLGLVGEHVWIVPPMTMPDPTSQPRADPDPRHPALTLFAERAAVVVPGFAIQPDNAEHVVDICRRLDGLPLAIELAAAQLRTLSVEQLAVALRDRFPRLAARHAIPAHHRTLAATFDWSFELCSPAERALWQRMSVFVDSFELKAIEYVCGGDEPGRDPTLTAIVGLVDKSVLCREEVGGRVRYRLLETVRQYGLERLRARTGEESALRQRHGDWYRQLAARFCAEWFGPDQRTWSTRMQREHPNLRAALCFSLTPTAERGAALALAADLRYTWHASGLVHEGRYWLDRALAADPEPTRARLSALVGVSWLRMSQGDLAGGALAAKECLDLGEQLGDPSFVARATAAIGIVVLLRGTDLPRARELLEQALASYAQRGESGIHVAIAQTSLGTVALHQGDIERAAELAAECRTACEARGDQWWRAYSLNLSALVALAQGDPATAAGQLRETVRLRDPLGDTLGLAGSIELLAWATTAAGSYEHAAVLLGCAHRLWQGLGHLLYGAPHWLRRHEECEVRLHNELGKTAYGRAFRRGTDFLPDEAVRYALEVDQPPGARSATVKDSTAEAATVVSPPLTKRELQVARLVTQGLSNKQIATQLVVSPRTAESHVENILRKLGFTSRAQLAAWVSGQHR